MRRIIYNLNYFLHWLITVKLRRHRYVSWHEIHNKGKFQNKKQVRSEKLTASSFRKVPSLHYYLHLSFWLQPFWSISSLLQLMQRRHRCLDEELRTEVSKRMEDQRKGCKQMFKEVLCSSAWFITDIIGWLIIHVFTTKFKLHKPLHHHLLRSIFNSLITHDLQ